MPCVQINQLHCLKTKTILHKAKTVFFYAFFLAYSDLGNMVLHLILRKRCGPYTDFQLVMSPERDSKQSTHFCVAIDGGCKVLGTESSIPLLLRIQGLLHLICPQLKRKLQSQGTHNYISNEAITLFFKSFFFI